MRLSEDKMQRSEGMISTIKDQQTWMIQFDLDYKFVDVSGWLTKTWTVENLGLPLCARDISEQRFALPLRLYRDERADYRYNLGANTPKLFFIFDITEDDSLSPTLITASQACAASYMDGEGIVLSITMPLVVQIWMEAFMSAHGEVEEEGKKKQMQERRSNDQ